LGTNLQRLSQQNTLAVSHRVPMLPESSNRLRTVGERRMILKKFLIQSSNTLLLIGLTTLVQAENTKLPDVSEFLMAQNREIALARSAAPDRVSKKATIMVLRENGYQTVVEGSNSFVCLVLRSWGNPTHDHKYMYDPNLAVPECLDANAVKTILPMQLFRAKLGTRMTPPAEIEAAIKEGFRSGRFHRTETVSFSYMLSAAMVFGDGHQGPPHIMIYLPDNYKNETVGGFPYSDQLIFVEGGPDQPFIAANIYLLDESIEPVFD
jgi:hypothetical protein